MMARTIEGAAAPEARASPQRMRMREKWCRDQYGLSDSDEFDPSNLGHLKVREGRDGARALGDSPALSLSFCLVSAHAPHSAHLYTLQARACVVGVRSLHTPSDMRNIAWDPKAGAGGW